MSEPCRCEKCGGWILNLDMILCGCGNGYTSGKIDDGAITGFVSMTDPITVSILNDIAETNDVQKNPGGGGGGDFEE